MLDVHPVGVVLPSTDLEAELEWLRSRGVRPESYDTDELKTVDGIADQGSVWSAWIADPDGNALDIKPRHRAGEVVR